VTRRISTAYASATASRPDPDAAGASGAAHPATDISHWPAVEPQFLVATLVPALEAAVVRISSGTGFYRREQAPRTGSRDAEMTADRAASRLLVAVSRPTTPVLRSCHTRTLGGPAVAAKTP
jgi:hypothetical protein